MHFTKADMQEELSRFLTLFGDQVACLYGLTDRSGSASWDVQDSPVWQAVNEMYDYGITGTPTGDLTPGSILDGKHAHVERFLYAIDTVPMRMYLDEQNNAPPRLAILSAQSAVARLVLDGGERHTDYATEEFGPGKGNWAYLTLAEVALLANMDERSVRNAANPKLPDPLKTEQIGRRALVHPEEARRWLSGRKGFISTKVSDADVAHRPPSFDIEVPVEFAEHVRQEADKLGVPFSVHLRNRFLSAAEKMLEGEKK